MSQNRTIAVLQPVQPVGNVRQPSHDIATMRALDHVSEEAASIAGAATRIVQMVQAAYKDGGQVNVQPQVNFVTGAWARLLKDLGRVEHLQQHGSVLKRRIR